MDAIGAVLDGHVPDLRAPGMAELVPLVTCPQTAAFHGEGDVATHTGMVLDIASELVGDLAGGTASAASQDWTPTILRLAALLHDIGKPEMTRELEPGVFSAKGHEDAGARTVSILFATHPRLRTLPLGVYPAVHALVRDHMWTYHIDRVSPGAMIRMAHLVDPRLLVALWQADTRGRVCDDSGRLADQVEYAQLVLEDALATARGGDRLVGSHGLLDHVVDVASLDPATRRQLLRATVSGEYRDRGAAAAAVAAGRWNARGGSLTYTIGLPGVGKSTWARTVWAPATGGVVLSAEGARRRDRKAAAASVVADIPRALAAGRHVCVDATHMTRESRDVLVTFAGRYGVPLHAVYFDSPVELSIQRQLTRPSADSVPEAAIRTMRSKLRWPTPDEYATLTVVPSTGRPWPYTDQTRWMAEKGRASVTSGFTPPWHQQAD